MIKIIVDSTAYIDETYLKQHDIKVVHLHTIVGEHDFIEGLPGTYQPIYDKIDELKVHSKTSQPPVQEFIDAYDHVIDNKDEAIIFTISSSLSGTYSVACLAKNSCKNPEKITVIDSGTCGHSIWGLVMEAVDMISKNMTREQIFDEIEKFKATSGIAFTPDNFDALRRGGRISLMSATIGYILNIKSILSFVDGKLSCAKKCLGSTMAISHMISMIPKNAKRIFIIRISTSPFFANLKSKVDEAFPNVERICGEFGPVIGAHIGKAIGVSWISPLPSEA